MRPIFLVVMLALFLTSSALAANFYSDNQYKFTTDYNKDYIYQWSASSGSYLESDKNTFSWTSPSVETPTEIVISLSVTRKTCKCQSYFDKIITVLPIENIVTSNDTSNLTSDTESETNSVPRNLTQNDTATYTAKIKDDAEPDLISIEDEVSTPADLQSGSDEMLSTEEIPTFEAASQVILITVRFDSGKSCRRSGRVRADTFWD